MLKWKYCNPHFSNGHVAETKILIFWNGDFITFVQIWFGPSISRNFHLSAVYLSKNLFQWISNWNNCSPYFSNSHVTEIKKLIFWIDDLICYNFYPNLTWTIDFDEFLFEGHLFMERPILVNNNGTYILNGT